MSCTSASNSRLVYVLPLPYQVYQMSDRCRGRVLIINIHTFRDTQQTRAGSHVDYDNISRLFKDMKFDIAKSRPELTDLTAQVFYGRI